jgi:hypothetical protein
LDRHSKWSAVNGHGSHGSEFCVELQWVV